MADAVAPPPPVEEAEEKGPTEAEKAELIMVNRVEKTLEVFTNEDGGIPAIPKEEVGHVIRACGCFVPEYVLIDSILPSISEDDYAELNIVRPELLRKRIIQMVKERTWEAETEHELLLAFRRLDQLAHSGEERGYIESDVMSKYMTSMGMVPFRKAESDSFLSFSNDSTGSKIFYYDYVGKVLPLLDDDDYLFSGAGNAAASAASRK